MRPTEVEDADSLPLAPSRLNGIGPAQHAPRCAKPV